MLYNVSDTLTHIHTHTHIPTSRLDLWRSTSEEHFCLLLTSEWSCEILQKISNFPNRSFPTDLTAIWFLSSMNYHMFVKSGLRFPCDFPDLTTGRFLTSMHWRDTNVLSQISFHVHDHVSFSRTFTWESSPTYLAVKRFLSCMCCHVCYQISFLCKWFPTDLTTVRFISNMDSHMPLILTLDTREKV